MMNNFGHCTDEAFWSKSNSKNIFIPSSEKSVRKASQISDFFAAIKSVNFVMVPWIKEGSSRITTEMITWTNLKFNSTSMTPSTNVDEVFPDRLRNMDQYQYKVCGREQEPRLFIRNDTLYGYDVIFMDAVAKTQNANYSIQSFGGTEFANLIINSKFDLSLNTINIGFLNNARKYFKCINTFETEGFCALIPIPQRNSFLKYIFTPYDWISWMLIAIAIATCSAVWKLFKSYPSGFNLDNPDVIIFGFIAYFLSQSITIHHT